MWECNSSMHWMRRGGGCGTPLASVQCAVPAELNGKFRNAALTGCSCRRWQTANTKVLMWLPARLCEQRRARSCKTLAFCSPVKLECARRRSCQLSCNSDMKLLIGLSDSIKIGQSTGEVTNRPPCWMYCFLRLPARDGD